MIDIEKIKLFKPCLKRVEFNGDKVEINLFYPVWFRDYFSEKLLDNGEEFRETYKGFIYETFEIEEIELTGFFGDFADVIDSVRTKLKKEILIKAQIESLKNVDFSSLVGQSSMQLDNSIIEEINNLEVYDYQKEVEQAYMEIIESSKDIQPNSFNGYDTQEYTVANLPNQPQSLPQTIERMDGITVQPMVMQHTPASGINLNDVDLLQSTPVDNTLYGEDDDIPC